MVIMTSSPSEDYDMTDLNIVEAKSRFSEVLARAAAGERFVIHRRSRPLAVLVSSAEWERMARTAALGQHLAQALGQTPEILDEIAAGTTHPIMAAFGLWQNEEDLADLASEIERNRQNQPLRPPLTP
jgi:prevent-host-death family protein